MNDFYLAQEKEIGLFTYNKRVIIGADFEPDGVNGTFNATAWFSGQPFHAEPLALAFLMNAFARQVLLTLLILKFIVLSIYFH